MSAKNKSQADAFQILARAVPDMLRALAESKKIVPNKSGQLGQITGKVADYLGVEICSIFLLEDDGRGGSQKLVLAEAFGYSDEAVGKPKRLDTGLTSLIAGERPDKSGQPGPQTEIVCNFTVQDHENWVGQLDGELTGHGWTLLGAPIVGTARTCKGVIKVENKKSLSHSDAIRTLLGATASRPKNTPKYILSLFEPLVKKAESTIDLWGAGDKIERDRQQRKLKEIIGIATLLGEGFDKLSADLPFTEKGADDPPSKLDENEQNPLFGKLQLQTAALVAAIDHLQAIPIMNESSLQEQFNNLRRTVASFDLALRAYTPFARTDVLLVRTVAALIAAALDLSEGTQEFTLHALQHGLKKGTTSFLKSITDLTEHTHAFWSINSSARMDLGTLWLTALNISGPQDSIGTNSAYPRDPLPVTFAEFFEKHLNSRLHYYRDCAEVWEKEISIPAEVNEGWQHLAEDKLLLQSKYLILGVCDILFCNAIEHSQCTHVRIRLLHRDEVAWIIIEDNGKGISLEDLAVYTQKGAGLSPQGRFGLKAANNALIQSGMELVTISNHAAGDEWTSQGIKIPINIPNDDGKIKL